MAAPGEGQTNSMRLVPNVGAHLGYPFDLLPGGLLVIEGPTHQRKAMVEELRSCAYDGPETL